MIHIAIGTKAQFIKMAPIIQELQRRNLKFNLIDLGQHSLITKNLREEFGIREPDIYLSKGKNVSHLFKGLIWLIKLFFKGFNAKWIKEKVFMNQKGACLIHGDTVSTFLALYFAKRTGVKIAHIEAGLRSYNYLEPFPEEIIRVIAMRLSDILFAPSKWAFNNLRKIGMEKKSVLLSGNTSIEATFYSLNKKMDIEVEQDKYVLITVHRMENILFKRRLKFIVDLISKISERIHVIFVQHPPTINQIKRFKLRKQLNEINNIRFLKILSHAHFIHLLKNCEFVVTDGGSIQEESYYLNKPCLLLRNCAERVEGLGENVIISKFSWGIINNFLNNYMKLKRKYLDMEVKPSLDILEYLSSYA